MALRNSAAFATVALSLVCASAAHAGTITVTSTADSGEGTLRAAVAGAAPGDTISLPAGTYTLTSGELVVAKALTIAGAGPASTTISGNDSSRIVALTGGDGLTVRGATLTKGRNQFGAVVEIGAPLLLEDVRLTDNHAGGAGASGFGLLNLSADGDGRSFSIRLNRVQATGNTVGGGGASGFGGVIDVASTDDDQTIDVTVDSSTLAGNLAGGGGGAGFGGAIDFSTSSDRSGGTVSIVNSTLSGNVASGPNGFGGAIDFAPSGTANTQKLVIVHSTIANNSASSGGGVFGPVTLRNSVLSGNGVGSCSTFALSQGGNVEGANTCGLTVSGGDRPNSDAQLGDLADNGGSVFTRALGEQSSAIDAGVSPCAILDARGATRNAGASCDAGAYERGGTFPEPDPPIITTPPPTTNPPGGSTPGATPGPPASGPAPASPQPSFAVSGFAVSPKRFKVGKRAVFSYTLSRRAASVKIAVAPAGKAKKKLRRGQVQRGSVKAGGRAGRNSVGFTGRFGRKTLAPGTYVATLEADSVKRKVKFKIVG